MAIHFVRVIPDYIKCDRCGCETPAPIQEIDMVSGGEVITMTVCDDCADEMHGKVPTPEAAPENAR